LGESITLKEENMRFLKKFFGLAERSNMKSTTPHVELPVRGLRLNPLPLKSSFLSATSRVMGLALFGTMLLSEIVLGGADAPNGQPKTKEITIFVESRLKDDWYKVTTIDPRKPTAPEVKEGTPNDFFKGVPVRLPSGDNIIIFGSGTMTGRGLALSGGSSFLYTKPQAFTIPDPAGGQIELSVFRFFEVRDGKLALHPMGLLRSNPFTKKLYFKTDLQSKVIEWGADIGGNMKALSVTIPDELQNLVVTRTGS